LVPWLQVRNKIVKPDNFTVFDSDKARLSGLQSANFGAFTDLNPPYWDVRFTLTSGSRRVLVMSAPKADLMTAHQTVSVAAFPLNARAARIKIDISRRLLIASAE
jgi:hypothetical protein